MSRKIIAEGTTHRRFLSPEEFSELSGLSLATIHRYLKSGKLPYRQPAGPRGRILIPVEALAVAPIEHTPTQQEHATDTTSLLHPPTTAELSPLSGPRPKWTRQVNTTRTKEI